MPISKLLKLQSDSPGVRSGPFVARDLLLIPGEDRLSDQIVEREQVYVTPLTANQWLPRGRPGVLIQMGEELGGESIIRDFVIAIQEVQSFSLAEFCREYGVDVQGENAPLDRHEPLPRSTSAFYIATQDGNIHVMRTTIHKGLRIAYFQALPVALPQQEGEGQNEKAPRERGF